MQVASGHKLPANGLRRNPDGVTRFARFRRNRLILLTRDQSRELRETRQEPGTIRRHWHRDPTYTGGPPPFSFTRNSFDGTPAPLAGVTTPSRFMVSTRDTITGGNLLSNPMVRPVTPPTVAHPAPPLVLGGNVQGRPTIRSRIPSFGSRIPALNQPVPGGME